MSEEVKTEAGNVVPPTAEEDKVAGIKRKLVIGPSKATHVVRSAAEVARVEHAALKSVGMSLDA